MAVATNQHVVSQDLDDVLIDGKRVTHVGYVAHTRDQEKRCPGLMADVLVKVDRRGTAEVGRSAGANGAVDPARRHHLKTDDFVGQLDAD
jgi:hypothetical protein